MAATEKQAPRLSFDFFRYLENNRLFKARCFNRFGATGGGQNNEPASTRKFSGNPIF